MYYMYNTPSLSTKNFKGYRKNRTSYVIHDEFIQFKTRALTTSLFISKREMIIEVGISRNIVQKMLGLASVETMNRGGPVYHTYINDVPIEVAHYYFPFVR